MFLPPVPELLQPSLDCWSNLSNDPGKSCRDLICLSNPRPIEHSKSSDCRTSTSDCCASSAQAWSNGLPTRPNPSGFCQSGPATPDRCLFVRPVPSPFIRSRHTTGHSCPVATCRSLCNHRLTPSSPMISITSFRTRDHIKSCIHIQFS